MISSKYEAVEYFSFMKNICSRGNACKKCEHKICGVLFLGNYAYSTNNTVVGRVCVQDNIYVDSIIFWSYVRDEPSKFSRDKFLLNVKGIVLQNPIIEEFVNSNFVENFDYYLSKSTDNDFYIRKSDVIEQIDELKLSSTKQNKMKINICPNVKCVDFLIEPIKCTRTMTQSFNFSLKYFAYPGTYHKIKIEPEVCCVINLFFFYEILSNAFNTYDIIKIKYNKNTPLTIVGSSKQKDDVYFAISQIPSE